MTIVEDRPQQAMFATARKAMIDSQLRTSGVNAEFVLQRMNAVAREDFVPEAAKSVAYMDRSIALEGKGFLAAPTVQGMMLQEAVPTQDDTVLLVDGGSGYMAELLRPLVGSLEVMSAEDAAAKKSRKGDVTLLIVDGAVEELPEGLTRCLADNGRIITGLLSNGITRLAAGRRVSGTVSLVPLMDIGMPVLPEFAVKKGWSF